MGKKAAILKIVEKEKDPEQKGNAVPINRDKTDP